ncbi:MAG: tryptophan synthase subunit alpha [Bacteroidetes bacterium GWF2_40_14]|nr:MAG: tryptophan synthase subunit alpha [Bacteroidetes bacterium GWF2_40_14]
MNRIDKLFQQKQNNLLSIYFTAGFPNLNDTLSIVRHLDKAGVDLIEIGFPFSDPLADGPVIQQSSGQAIENGMTLSMLFEQLKDVRRHTQIPLVLMGYMNPVLQFGEKEFFKKCNEIGIDGVILPDMPLDYFECKLQNIVEENDIANILLITPETNSERINQIDNLSRGFLYMVSSNSITGGNKTMDMQTEYFYRIKAMNLKNPTLIGFGIKNKETYENACKYSNGAIIGTAFIEHLKQHGIAKESIQTFIKSIRK